MWNWDITLAVLAFLVQCGLALVGLQLARWRYKAVFISLVVAGLILTVASVRRAIESSSKIERGLESIEGGIGVIRERIHTPPPPEETRSTSVEQARGTKRARVPPGSREYVPSLDLTFDPAGPAFNFVNRGPANLYLWGDRLDGGPRSIGPPVTITPTGGYHIWVADVVNEIKRKLGPNGEARVPFLAYVSTDDNKKHILHYSLWITMSHGAVRIETQNYGTTDEDFTKQ